MLIKKYSTFILLLMLCFMPSCSEDIILSPVPITLTHPKLLLVPQQYSTIQSAIDSASVNDTILVSPGTYYENINFSGKNIIIKSSGTAENTIIDGRNSADPYNSSVVKFPTSNVNTISELIGFTITGCANTYYGGGILIENSRPLIKNCIIRNNKAVRGGGIACINDWDHQTLAGPTIEFCVITNNTATGGSGAGVYTRLFGNIDIKNCTLVSNGSNAGNNFGSESLSQAAMSKVKNSIFWGLSSIVSSYASVEINYCDIQGGWPSGVGNINSDPMFCNSVLNNYHVALNSPCVSTGENGSTIGALGTCDQEYRRFDYPLEIGTTWKYSYSYSSSHMGEWWYRRGIHFWTVVDSSALSNDIVRFSIKSINYDSTASNYDPTVRYIIDSLIFYIDAGVDIVVVRPPSYVSGIEDNIQGLFSGSDSVKIGGRTYIEQIGLTNMLHENLTNSFYREKQQLIEFNKKRK